jgi:hypothetical protein
MGRATTDGHGCAQTLAHTNTIWNVTNLGVGRCGGHEKPRGLLLLPTPLLHGATCVAQTSSEWVSWGAKASRLHACQPAATARGGLTSGRLERSCHLNSSWVCDYQLVFHFLPDSPAGSAPDHISGVCTQHPHYSAYPVSAWCCAGLADWSDYHLTSHDSSCINQVCGCMVPFCSVLCSVCGWRALHINHAFQLCRRCCHSAVLCCAVLCGCSAQHLYQPRRSMLAALKQSSILPTRAPARAASHPPVHSPAGRPGHLPRAVPDQNQQDAPGFWGACCWHPPHQSPRLHSHSAAARLYSWAPPCVAAAAPAAAAGVITTGGWSRFSPGEPVLRLRGWKTAEAVSSCDTISLAKDSCTCSLPAAPKCHTS